MNNAKIALSLTILGVMFSLVTLGLLIASQIKQKWIWYVFTINGNFGGVAYTFTTSANIGIWNYYYLLQKLYVPNVSIYVDGIETGTEDSSTSGFFSEEAVKACRALAILATMSTFINIVTAIGTHILSMKATENDSRLSKLNIIIISTAGFTVFTATLALIVVRTQFKDGMSIDTSFYIAIVANITCAIALVMYVMTYFLIYYKFKGSSITQVLPVEEPVSKDNGGKKIISTN